MIDDSEQVFARRLAELVRHTALDEDRARFLLKANEWSVEAALKQWLSESAARILIDAENGQNDEEFEERSASTSRDEEEEDEEADRALWTAAYAFRLPNLELLPLGFRHFVERTVLEANSQKRLEQQQRLNWWAPRYGRRLWALTTSGDGNCLLHAASLSAWGLHDRKLLLRRALHDLLRRGSRRHALWRRWKFAEHASNVAHEVQLTDEQWSEEWYNLVRLASPTPRTTKKTASVGQPVPMEDEKVESPPAQKEEPKAKETTDQTYASLEALHVFALAHVLKRPIIVVADTVLRNAKGEALSPVAFGGLYLPLECPPQVCHRSPLVLAYDAAHFSALVPTRTAGAEEPGRPAIIPIVDVSRKLLPLHFAVDPGADFSWWRTRRAAADDERIADRLKLTPKKQLEFMAQYLDLVRVDVDRTGTCVRRVVALRAPGEGVATENGAEPSLKLRQRWTNWTTTKLKKLRGVRSVNGVQELTEADLSSPRSLVGALLMPGEQEYMRRMTDAFLNSARRRYDASITQQQTPTNATTEPVAANGTIGAVNGSNSNGTTTAAAAASNNGTAASNGAVANSNQTRLTRAFSASSVLEMCINQGCLQPAFQGGPPLCGRCLELQRAHLTAFRPPQGATFDRKVVGGVLPPAPALIRMAEEAMLFDDDDLLEEENRPATAAVLERFGGGGGGGGGGGKESPTTTTASSSFSSALSAPNFTAANGREYAEAAAPEQKKPATLYLNGGDQKQSVSAVQSGYGVTRYFIDDDDGDDNDDEHEEKS